ncbi:MAG: hypothetical protein COA49_04440 [Bacteroidetes bacterium]|nr:MAG: hypothetical protein COA49_04440 [Bacteroidota bacterium]
MKPFKTFYFLLVLGLLAFPSCDIIEDPIVPFTGGYNSELYGEPPVFGLATTTGKNVLVEDFTAHQCGNCPPAAVIADGLANANPTRVFPMAVHAGNLAVTDEQYPMDWTNDDSNTLWNQLSFQANPIGRINRLGGSGNFFSPSEWSAKVASELNAATPLQLQIETSWYPGAGDGQLNIHVNGQFSYAIEGECRLSILFLESGLIGDQLDYGSDPEHIEDYEFNHMLRGSVTGAEGLVVIDNAVAGDSFQSDYTFNWNSEWVFENSSILLVVEDDEGVVVNCLGHHLGE